MGGGSGERITDARSPTAGVTRPGTAASWEERSVQSMSTIAVDGVSPMQGDDEPWETIAGDGEEEVLGSWRGCWGHLGPNVNF